MATESPAGGLPERRRNALLRRVDWRFLLRQSGRPRAARLRSSRAEEALSLVADLVPGRQGSADVAVVGFPSRGTIEDARRALRPGGEVICALRLPLPAGPALARRRLQRAGFVDVRVYWPGPLPHRLPQFWLPLGSPAATERLLELRPPRSRANAALRVAWRALQWAGLLAPLCVLAGLPAEEAEDSVAATPGDRELLLLTGGHRSINKAVGLPIGPQSRDAGLAIKFARVEEAEPGLEREARVLGALERDRPSMAGLPRVRDVGRRAGRLAVAETTIEGRSLLEALTPASFGEIAIRVTRLLVELAGEAEPRPPSEWWARLVGEPLDEFERTFGPSVGDGVASRARRVLSELPPLPIVCEHRDCSPWNIVLTDSGPALLDWESSELRGAPGLDLVYFLGNAAFVLDGALESGRTREAYALLLDPATPHGRVAAACIEEYRERLRIDAETFRRLRLLCWLVHTRSEFRHLEMDVAGAPAGEDLGRGVFLGLMMEELSGDQE